MLMLMYRLGTPSDHCQDITSARLGVSAEIPWRVVTVKDSLDILILFSTPKFSIKHNPLVFSVLYSIPVPVPVS